MSLFLCMYFVVVVENMTFKIIMCFNSGNQISPFPRACLFFLLFFILIVLYSPFAEDQPEMETKGLPRSFLSFSQGTHSHVLIFFIYAVVFKCPSL